jgi:group I intron endonuclease
MNLNCGIYCIKNLVNDKIYIGSSRNFKRRKQEHISELRHNRHHNNHLQNSWNKYGEYNFIFEILEYCSIEDLQPREQIWIDITKSYNRDVGYNIRPTANNSSTSEETRLKLSKLSMGRKNNLGKVWTIEHRERISDSNKGRKLSEEHKEKLRKPHKSYNISKENKERIISNKRKYKHLFDEWVILYNNGYSYVDIGKKYNIDNEIIRRNLVKYDDNKVNKNNIKHYHLFNKIIELHINKYNGKQISEKLNISSSTVYRYIREYQLNLK